MIQKLYRRIIDRQKEKNLKQQTESLRSGFKVKERGGKLWLLHNGVAFCEIPASSNATEIADQIETARIAAVQYESV